MKQRAWASTDWTLGAAMRKSVDELYATGAMKSILAKWGLGAFGLRR